MTKLTVCHQILFRQHLLASKNLKRLHFNIEVHFLNSMITITWPLQLYTSTKVSVDLAYIGFVAKSAWLSDDKSLCRMLLMPKIDSLIHHRDKDTLFASCLLHKLLFIRLCAYIIYFTLELKCLTELLRKSPTLDQPMPNNTACGTLSLYTYTYV